MDGPYYLLMEKKRNQIVVYGKKEDDELFVNSFCEKISFLDFKVALLEIMDSVFEKAGKTRIWDKNLKKLFDNFLLLKSL